MSAPANYVLGQSAHEYERLMLQSKILRHYTDKYFRAAGLGPGMRVLDLGSGMGDVALLAGEIVGPRGQVLGIDRDANALERARQRTIEQGCSSWVSFQATNLDDFTAEGPFDAVVGRYILLYQSDPAATIRRLLSFLKPGGIVAFHELDFTDPRSSDPPCALWDQLYFLVGETFRRVGSPPDFGRRIATAFTGAGLSFPAIVADIVAGGGPGSYLYPWLAGTIVSVAPRLGEFGLAMPAGVVADQELAGKVEQAALASGSQIAGPTQYGAWTRKPL